MKVGLYFGSFNPIHHGHLIIANHIYNYTDCEEVWLIVSPQNPLKKPGTLLNDYQRLHLANLAVLDDPYLKVKDIEFRLPKPSFTVDSMAYIQEKYPENQFYIIVGADSWLNISKWKNNTQLIDNHIFIIYPRTGFPIDIPPNSKHMYVQAPLIEISASSIRSMIREKKSIRYLLPENVREEIEMAGYYKKSI